MDNIQEPLRGEGLILGGLELLSYEFLKCCYKSFFLYVIKP